jgi:hypothetical protein
MHYHEFTRLYLDGKIPPEILKLEEDGKKNLLTLAGECLNMRWYARIALYTIGLIFGGMVYNVMGAHSTSEALGILAGYLLGLLGTIILYKTFSRHSNDATVDTAIAMLERLPAHTPS